MPGLLATPTVSPGDIVARGDTLAVMESMTLLMKLNVTATERVAKIAAREGNALAAEQLPVRPALVE